MISIGAWAYPTPSTTSYVNDFEGLLTVDQIKEVDKVLVDLEAKTTIQMAVVTVDSLEGQTVEQYAIGIGDAWGVGQKGKNNGVVFLLSAKERQVYIRLAEGLNNSTNEWKIQNIYSGTLVPLGKKNDFAGMVIIGVRELSNYFLDAYTTTTTVTEPVFVPNIDWSFVVIFLSILLGAILIIVFTWRYFDKKNKDKMFEKETRESISKSINELGKKIDFVEKIVKKYSHDQWEPDWLKGSVESLRKSHDDLLNDYYAAKSIDDLIRLVEKDIKDLEEAVDRSYNLCQFRERIQWNLYNAQGLLEKLPTLKVEVANSLSRLESTYPEEVWVEWKNKFDGLAGFKSLEEEWNKINNLLSTATIEELYKITDEVVFLYERTRAIHTVLEELGEHEAEVERIYRCAPEMLKQIEDSLIKAKRMPLRAQNHFDEAKQRYDSAKSMAEGSSPNWMVIWPLLMMANDSYKQAESIRVDDESSSSSYHSSSQSDDSSSSFGGFDGGGGFSGGCGAGGGF